VIRKHRLIEIFLVETLDYEWDEVHAEAEQLEHSVSDKLAQRIDDFLGNPQFDPHGDPIPTADGQIIKRNSIPLNQAIPGQRVRIARVLDQQPDVLRHLTRQKLVPQTEIEVMEVLPFDGQMTVQVGENDVTISRTLASRLLVTPAAE
jgi:DtxR family Mn-dependent transcriptional regulator